MAKKISELPSAPGKALTSVLPIVVGGVTSQIALGALVGGDRTGLTGGGSSNLDGVVSVDQQVGQLWNVVIGGQVYHYQLQAGTSSENSPYVIRPDDYNGATNQKIFQLLGIYGVTVESHRTVIGEGAGPMLVGGGDNTILGRKAGAVLTDSNQNSVMVGAYAGFKMDGAGNNTFIGYRTGYNNDSGQDNVVVGYNAGNQFGSGGFADCVIIGSRAARTLNGQSHGAIVIGFGAGGQVAEWEMGEDIVIGANAATSMSYTYGNSLVGASVARYGTVFSNNSFFGAYSGKFLSTGSRNSFFGHSSGKNNSTGELNCFFGSYAGGKIATGRRNTFIGAQTGNATGDNTSGALVLGYGARALNDNEASAGSSTVPLNTVAGGTIPHTAEKFLILRVNGDLFMLPLLRVLDTGHLTMTTFAPTVV